LKEITVDTYDEFEELTKAQDIRVAEALYDAIINNLKTKKKNIHFLTVYVNEDESICDLSIEREQFDNTLENIIHTLIKHEEYEKCSKIKKILNKK